MRLHIYTSVLCLLCFFTASAQKLEAIKTWLSQPASSRGYFQQLPGVNEPLTRQEATEATTIMLEDAKERLRKQLEASWKNKLIVSDNDTLRFEYKVFGAKPADGRSLFISMHGGGNAPARVNDQQWRNQVSLYTPAEGIYVAPRAPSNTWNMWHESHVDTLFDQLIKSAMLFEDVNPDKVYIMGYSAGGDGVYQLAPRMADRLAAAAMMAGHPNETSPLGLRNLPFTLHMGALDSAYKRNQIARRWAVMLDSLRRKDPGGYTHFVQLHEGRAHWMNKEDTVAVSWMMKHRRNTIPSKVVWKQDDVQKLQYYWLAVPENSLKTGGEVVVSMKGNQLNIERNDSDTLLIRLNDNMMNLDKKVVVKNSGKKIFKGRINRNLATIHKTIEERKDPKLVFTSEIRVAGNKVVSSN